MLYTSNSCFKIADKLVTFAFYNYNLYYLFFRILMTVSLCVFLCALVSVREHISGTIRPIFANMYACYLYGPVLLCCHVTHFRFFG